MCWLALATLLAIGPDLVTLHFKRFRSGAHSVACLREAARKVHWDARGLVSAVSFNRWALAYVGGHPPYSAPRARRPVVKSRVKTDRVAWLQGPWKRAADRLSPTPNDLEQYASGFSDPWTVSVELWSASASGAAIELGDAPRPAIAYGLLPAPSSSTIAPWPQLRPRWRSSHEWNHVGRHVPECSVPPGLADPSAQITDWDFGPDARASPWVSRGGEQLEQMPWIVDPMLLASMCMVEALTGTAHTLSW